MTKSKGLVGPENSHETEPSNHTLITDMTSCVVDTPFLVKAYKRQTGVIEDTIKQATEKEKMRLQLLNRCHNRVEREKLRDRFELEREKDIQHIKDVSEDRDVLINAFAAKARGDLTTYRVDRHDYSEELSNLKGDVGPLNLKSREFVWDPKELFLREKFWGKLEDPTYGRKPVNIGRKNPTYLLPKSDPTYDPFVELLNERKSILTSMQKIVNEEESLLKTWQQSYNHGDTMGSSSRSGGRKSSNHSNLSFSNNKNSLHKKSSSATSRPIPKSYNALNTARTTSTLASMATFVSKESTSNRSIAKVSSTHRQYNNSQNPKMLSQIKETHRSTHSNLSNTSNKIQVPNIW